MAVINAAFGSGNEAPFFMIAYFVMSGVLLRAFSPPFGRCK